MPDGGLPEHQDSLTGHIVEAAGRLGITHFHTLGEQGYDGHRDHIATHEATLAAAKELEIPDAATIWALQADHAGERAVKGDELLKLGAMACHICQFDLASPDFWESFQIYTPLIWQAETYDQIKL